MKFNYGDLVYIRTTGELGTILEGTIENINGEDKTSYSIRVPSIDKEGRVSHIAPQVFTEPELETFEERITREVNNIALEQQIRTVTKETYDKWVEGRTQVTAIDKISLVQ